MREILFDYLRKQEKLIIYGCGYNGKFLQWMLERNNIVIDFWCDSNQSFWNKKICGIECISPQCLSNDKNAVVIISIYQYKEVWNRLKEYHFKKLLTWDDVCFLYDKLDHYSDEIRAYRESVLNQVPDLKQRLQSNYRFKNIHRDGRCFIVGNGPSVRGQNLSVLCDEITFTVNQMARSPKFADIHTNYHLWADAHFFRTDLSCEGDYELLNVIRNLPENVECFFPYESAHDYIKKYELEKNIHVNYYSSNAMVGEGEIIDFTTYIRGGYTVVQYAIRLAIYMGFKEIYILGCECTTIQNVINARLAEYSSKTHCYDIDEKEKERARRMYFELPMQAYYQSELGVLEEYRKLKKYCDSNHIRIVNCTPGGLLEEIPRLSYEDVINRIL